MGIFRWVKSLSGNTLYFPGCVTKAVALEEFENYKKIFNILDISFVLLKEEFCCGLVALNAGYKKDARKLAKKNFDLFKKNNISRIITNCSSCYKTFKEVYPQLIKEWNLEVDTAISEILRGLKSSGINLGGEKSGVENVVYNDSCEEPQDGLYDAAREIINRLGGKIIEMENNKENTICCGASGGIIYNFPDVALKAARMRVEESPSKEFRIISPSVLCNYNLKKVTDKSIEISTFILERLQSMPK